MRKWRRVERHQLFLLYMLITKRQKLKSELQGTDNDTNL